MAPRPDAPAGLYAHVPFCVRKCAYCAFHSEPGLERIDAWLDAFAREAALRARTFDTFDTLYVGGGTPSVLAPAALARLLDTIERNFRIAADAERTLEVNPGDVDPERAALWLRLGFNRVSVGVQSFDDGDLAFLGRRHDAARARTALRVLREAGFASIGTDVIFALPGRSADGVLRTLEEVLSHRPEHISCYELTIEPRTPIGIAAAAGRLVPLDEDSAASATVRVWRILEQAGYDHYEVSSFARGKAHRSRHNQKYWNHTPYLGLGPAAHSFDGSRRWCNVPTIQAYIDALMLGVEPTDQQEALSPHQLRVERIALGLRTSLGVKLADVRGATTEALLANLAQQGLVTVGERVCATEAGMLVADGLARALVTLLYDDESS